MINNIVNEYADLLEAEKMPPGKRKVLVAAIRLFSERGFNGTSTALIAETAEVSEATVFKYFKTKDMILKTILDYSIPRTFGDFLDEFFKQRETHDLIEFFVYNRFAFLQTNQDLIKIILQEILVNSDFKMFLMNKFRSEMVKRNLAQCIRMLQEKNPHFNQELRLEDIIRIFFGALAPYFFQRFVFNVAVEDEERDLKQLVKQIEAALYR